MSLLLLSLAIVIGMIYGMLLGKELLKGYSLNYSYITKLSSLFLIPVLMESFFIVLLYRGVVTIFSLVVVVSSIILGVMLLSFIFGGLTRRFGQNWLTIIYYIGIVFTFMTAAFMSVEMSMSYIIDQFMASHAVIASCIAICSAPFAGIAWLISRVERHEPNNFAHVKSGKVQHYRHHGLSDSDIDFFRSQMAEAKVRIENSEKNMQAVAKLRIIETRHNTIDVAKQFFKDIVAEPARLPQVGIFMNKLLPSLEDLTAKYVEISNHVAKNKQTYLILDKSASTIEKICESITEQYLQFHQSVYNDLDDEIKLANKNLYKASETLKEENVDSLVEDPFAFDDFE
ncbi:5-bromo-4-chloroindolyl phosphate hydrolysis family protein [Aerococcaceae bacterium zg-ZUI334]|uniref:5-bromo-4-chloroindolyl phosphate hydrolysis family protein n=1 Tax=Aerococcaceae bacterium zg-252 TaxID=2796928 RepID=UPI001BA38997|nr:5-bromo-4-chloroindolyl phosphate hydrolysis family protein [Aerococcaceae bacterium zg-ZUI334]